MPEPITTHDDQHRRLARGAIRHAHHITDLDMLDRLTHGGVVDVDVIAEAESAWAETGLIPASLSDREVREVCAIIAGRVATVLVMVGWQPPSRLLTDPAQPAPVVEGHTDTGVTDR